MSYPLPYLIKLNCFFHSDLSYHSGIGPSLDIVQFQVVYFKTKSLIDQMLVITTETLTCNFL